MSDIDWLSIECAYCGAKISDRCRTVSGAYTPIPHNARMAPLSAAYGAGWQEGFENGKRVQRRRDERR